MTREDLFKAIGLLPVLKDLYGKGIIDVQPGGTPYIQLREKEMREMFPEAAKDENGYLIDLTYGVKVLAVPGSKL